jgi:hypothetical protein
MFGHQFLAVIHKPQNSLALSVVEYALSNLPNLVRSAMEFGDRSTVLHLVYLLSTGILGKEDYGRSIFRVREHWR